MQFTDFFTITSPTEFEKIALELFQYQAKNNKVYKEYISYFNINTRTINSIEKIPFLPIQFYKTHQIISTKTAIKQVFTSSGTTGKQTSKHYVTDISLYQNTFQNTFQHFYGNIKDYVILGLLPSYLEREGSSLIYMVEDLIKQSKHSKSGFYLDNLSALQQSLVNLDSQGKKVILIGVSFALLDLIESHQFQLKNTIIMETGGMKGRRKEIIRKELHQKLKTGFGVKTIHSEYGMTELLSQAYSKGNGIFSTPPWMKVLIRDSEDALQLLPHQRTGGINIIDLANRNSCAFIATQDLGKTYANNTFEVLGRFDHSDIRGCNLLMD